MPAPNASQQTQKAPQSGMRTNEFRDDKVGEKNVRESNIIAAKGVADTIRTSLGPKGMDKMITSPANEVIITNDGATILKKLELRHPAAQMMVELSKAQDVEAGDGTTSVVVLAGSMMNAALNLLQKGIHPTIISESFLHAAKKSQELLQDISLPLELSDRESLLKSATTSLNSKLVSQYSSLFAPIAVDAVLRIVDPALSCENVNLEDIKITKKVGGTIDDTELVDGLVFDQKACHSAGGPTRMEKAKIGLIQFQLSPPKTNMENSIVISDYTQMDRVLREERRYILNMCKKIHASGCNVLLIQKSILRDAVNELSLHFLAKQKIMVIKDVERTDVEFISRVCGCVPVASLDGFVPEKLGSANLVEEISTGGTGKVIKITGVHMETSAFKDTHRGHAVSVLVRGANKLIVDEAERSLHDALCVIRSLVKCRFLCPGGGGAPETHLSVALAKYAKTIHGLESYCLREYADALEVIPYTLAENAGLNPIEVVTQLRRHHAEGNKTFGINVRKGTRAITKITDMLEENVVAPLLVYKSAIQLATETVCMILKIDNIVQGR